MRVLMIYRPEQDLETAPLPTPEHFARMGQYLGEMTKAGVLLDTGGLMPSSRGATVRRSRGRFTVIDGPFTESKEVIVGFALMQLASLDEAKQAATRFLDIAGDGENEIRVMCESADFDPRVPRPAMTRYMMIWRPSLDALPPSRETIQRITTLADEQRAQGILLANEGLKPTETGARVRQARGKITVIDGPFAEAKELVGGYALVKVRSIAEAKEHAKTFLAIAGDGETEVRPAIEPGDFQ